MKLNPTQTAAAEYVIKHGALIAQAARKYAVSPSTIRRWMDAYTETQCSKITYTIDYQKKVGRYESRIRRRVVETFNGWLLKDANDRNIRSFADLASAIAWIDEEARS